MWYNRNNLSLIQAGMGSSITSAAEWSYTNGLISSAIKWTEWGAIW